MTHSAPPKPSHLRRAFSLLRRGPWPIVLRFYDQVWRKRSGTPVWRLSQVDSYLYVGGQHYVKGWAAMEREGIAAVVNLREATYDDAAQGICGSAYLHLPTLDNTPPTPEALLQGAQFIQQHIAAGRKVYVHCGVGVGRAPTQAAAYLILAGCSAEEALRRIQRVRPFIHLTGGQKAALRAFEQQCRA